jgi:type IV pilus assembly protein PilE
MPNTSRGFTLIEMMIVVVIVAILASIAFPSYQEYMRRSYRAEGQAFLNDVAARQERYYSQNYTYVTAVDKLSNLGVTDTSETGRYTLTLEATDGYTLTATPTFTDPRCGNLTLNGKGEKNVTEGDKSYCWK